MTAFDSDKYIALQTAKIQERLDKFPQGKLYFEIGGKFLNDEHAARVLPGFDPHSKIKVLQNFHAKYSIIFCISSPDVENDRVWTPGETYEDTLWKGLEAMTEAGLSQPIMAINLYKREPKTNELIGKLHARGYETFIRHRILGYPQNLDEIVGPNGYGKDEYAYLPEQLVIVTGLGSNSGKMSTCLGQVYLDKFHGMDSGYAKYETFPIWNLPLKHPVNLAYEAATADIGDFNVYDTFYKEAYGEESVNYNRDVDAFPILAKIIARIVDPGNYMHKYRSPTDMGINMSKDGITDENTVIQAAIAEIEHRLAEYQSMIASGDAKPEWVSHCQDLLLQAKSFPQI